MPVITISRWTGSGGAGIGQRVAEKLGAVYLDRQIIQEVAQRLGISEKAAAAYDERGDSFVDRLTRILWLSTTSFAPLDMGQVPASYQSMSEQEVEVTRQMIRETARMGNAIIMGHGAQFVLAGRPGVLHVQCVAPLEYRVQRMMRLRNWTQPVAERWVRQEDERRVGYARQFYRADWRSPLAFHLVLNTSLWSEDDCVDLILAAAERLPQPTQEQTTQGQAADASP